MMVVEIHPNVKSLSAARIIMQVMKDTTFFCSKWSDKWPDKSTTSYSTLDLKSDLENLQLIYLLIKL